MATDGRSGGGGIRIVEDGIGRQIVLLAVVVVAIYPLLRVVRSFVGETPPTPESAPVVPHPPESTAPSEAHRGAVPEAAPPPAATAPGTRARARRRARPADRAESRTLDAKDVIPALQAAGERTGIAVFPLPGTDPPKGGIIVPEEFVLPEGFVRHYQVTDEGEQLPAILMFSPDYEWVDAQGTPIALPDDRIVPPDLAPPDLPIRLLEIPEPKGARAPTP